MKSKKWVFSVIIVFVAAAISWWSGYQEAGIRTRVQIEITKLVPMFHEDPALVQQFVVNPILEDSLANSLEFVYHRSLQQNLSFVVLVEDGDDDEYGDGRATHVATIQINEEPVAGYRVICDSDSDHILIAGVLPRNPSQ